MKRILTLIFILSIAFAIGMGVSYAQEETSEAPKIDTGDTAWMIVATALVMLMTVPGLALFYGGMAKIKDSLNTIAMSLVAYAIVSVVWVIYGYTLAFSGDVSKIIGNLDKIFLSNITSESVIGTIPELLFVVFQLTFAAITVALISGAFIERIKFSVWIIFVIVWVTLVYVPIAHWVWGGGFLANLGALDFAGGTVVHINAGIAALVGVLFLGRRLTPNLLPSNLTLVVIGAGLLWFGWFGFNAGSAVASNSLAAQAFINTNLATAVAALTWMFTEWIITQKPTVLGFASGVIAGLVGITPAAGFVDVYGSIVIGALASLMSYFAVTQLKQKLGYDDALDVFGIHGISGIVGAILTGIFANPAVNSLGIGLLYGNPNQLWIQLVAVIVTIVYTGIMTFLILGAISVFTKLRVTEEEEVTGLDTNIHGEEAYNLIQINVNYKEYK